MVLPELLDTAGESHTLEFTYLAMDLSVNRVRPPKAMPDFQNWKPDPLHLCDSPRKWLSRANPVLSGTNPYNTGKRENYIILLIHQSTTFRHKPGTSPTGLNKKGKTSTQRIYRSEASPAPQANLSVGPALVLPSFLVVVVVDHQV